jgi:hypothetical protein
VSFGVIVNERTAPAASGVPVDTGQAFVTGPVASGAGATPVLCGSTADFETTFGPRQGASVALWDWLDVAFREGLTLAYVLGYTTPGDYVTALPEFDSRLGPGQVAVVGEPAAPAVYEAIQAHADANNRIGLLDVNDADTLAELTQHGTDAQALTSLENVGVFGSWATCAGPPGVVSSTGRNVPASAVIAGLCNRVDQTGNPGRAAGGRDFPLQYVNGFELDPDDTDRASLFAVGVNAFADRYGVLENYGFVTPIYQGQPIASTPFWQLNCSRTRMYMKAQALAIGENYYMRTLDGAGVLAGELGSDLAVMCSNLYEADALYGDTKADAYNVNVSQSVNTTVSAASATLNAVVEARLSQYTEKVVINLVSVPVAGVVTSG